MAQHLRQLGDVCRDASRLVAGPQDPAARGWVFDLYPAGPVTVGLFADALERQIVQLSDTAGHFQACDQLSIAGVPAHP